MSAIILRMPRRRPRASRAPRLHHLADYVRASREATAGLDHADELVVLLCYVKSDPPSHLLAAEIGRSVEDTGLLLKRGGYLLRGDESFRNAFHRINSRLD